MSKADQDSVVLGLLMTATCDQGYSVRTAKRNQLISRHFGIRVAFHV